MASDILDRLSNFLRGLIPALGPFKGHIVGFNDFYPLDNPDRATFCEEYRKARYQYATTSRSASDMSPKLILYPKDDADILYAIKYANDENIRIAVRTGGHAYHGTSSSNSQNIQLDLSKTYSGDWIDRGNGVYRVGISRKLKTFSEELRARELFIPHGQCSHVHLGGHVQTGGYGQLGRSFGLFGDHVVGIRIIAADERIIEATPTNEPDLFNAILGGSPGNFGILTHIDIQPIPSHECHAYGMKGVVSFSKETAKRLFDLVAETDQLPSYFDLCVTYLSHKKSMWRLGWKWFWHRQEDSEMNQDLDLLDTPAVLVIYAQWAKRGDPPSNAERQQAQEWFQRIHSTATPRGSIDLIALAAGMKLPDMSSPTPMHELTPMWIYQHQREFNKPYVKRTYLTTNDSATLSQKQWSTWLANRIEVIREDPKFNYCYLSVQIQNFGGAQSNFFTNDPQRTKSYSWRDVTVVNVLDCFYGESDPISEKEGKRQANKWQQENDTYFDKFTDGRDRRVFWGMFDKAEDSPFLSDSQNFYFEDVEKYNKLRAIKQKYDRNDLFSANSYSIRSIDASHNITRPPNSAFASVPSSSTESSILGPSTSSGPLPTSSGLSPGSSTASHPESIFPSGFPLPPANSWDLIVVDLTSQQNTPTNIQDTIEAVSIQVNSHFSPIWKVELGYLRLDNSEEMQELKRRFPGGPRDKNAIELAEQFVTWYWRQHENGSVDWRRTGIVYLTDKQRDFGGVHLDLKVRGRIGFDIPYALVGVDDPNEWTLTFSHEVLELLADPFGTRFVKRSPPLISPRRGSEKWIVEICDPSEAADYGYKIDGILVSDFLYPAYFDTSNTSGPFSYGRHITRPFQILRGGYLSFFHNHNTADERDDIWYQVTWFGAQPTIKHLEMKNVKNNMDISHRLRKYYMTRMHKKFAKSHDHHLAPFHSRSSLISAAFIQPFELFDRWVFRPVQDTISGANFVIDSMTQTAGGMLNLLDDLFTGRVPASALPLLGLEPSDLVPLSNFPKHALPEYLKFQKLVIDMTLFSTLAYCDPRDRPIRELVDQKVLPVRPILISAGFAQVMLFDYPKLKLCVIAFRGTEWPFLPLTPTSFNQAIGDWYRNFSGGLVHHPSFVAGQVHKSFLKAVTLLFQAGLEDYLRSRNDYRYFVTGHSQGAALALLAAPKIREINSIIQVYAIAAPVVGDAVFVESYNQLGIPTYRFYNNLDPILFARLETGYAYGPGSKIHLWRPGQQAIPRPPAPTTNAAETFEQILSDSTISGYWTIFDHFPAGPRFPIIGLWNSSNRPGYLEVLNRIIFPIVTQTNTEDQNLVVV